LDITKTNNRTDYDSQIAGVQDNFNDFHMINPEKLAHELGFVDTL